MFVYCYVKGAVHGFQLILLGLHLHLVKHVFTVKVKVTTGFPQVHLGGGMHRKRV